ncbi:MAG: TrkH family potassium uptake protein [Proteobacteria bacterium]|nr:TrkH family potassium uptake protein [Pseudomonadota bacterium]
MRDFRPVAFILGLLLVTLSLGMCVAAAVDGAAGHADWMVFLASAVVTLFVGVGLTLSYRTQPFNLSLRQAFLVTTLAWIVIPLFGTLPLLFTEMPLTFTDAFFEAMSGVTTTGATVIADLEVLPPGILIWRAMLQWLGGIGIILISIALLPILRVGGMQLFRMESSDRSEKALPRIPQIAAGIGLIYIGLSALCALGYWLAGMSGFDAISHAMTTVSTAGFSTRNASLGHFNNAWVDAVAVTGMLMGALPFILYLRALQGDARGFLSDSQVRVFLLTVAVLVGVVASWLWLNQGMSSVTAFRYASVHVVSIMTGTGYATAAFDTWGTLMMPLFLFIMVIGGCAGSSSCGIKIFRFQVLTASASTQIRRLMHPHGVFVPHYNGRPVGDEVILSILGFFFLFGTTISILAVGLSLLGLDFVTALSSAVTAVANVGPGLGPVVGPAYTFAALPDAAKWLMSVGMLLGRLELFTVLVLFLPTFWRD